MGIRKANVLPVPVWAVARMSLPSSAGGIADAWTGVGVMNCNCANFCWSPADRGISVNLVKTFLYLSWRGVSRGGPHRRASREDTTKPLWMYSALKSKRKQERRE